MGVFDLHDLNPISQEFEPVISSRIYNNSDIELEYDEQKRPIYWEGFNFGKFPDSPKCGYDKAKCPIKGFYLISEFLKNYYYKQIF